MTWCVAIRHLAYTQEGQPLEWWLLEEPATNKQFVAKCVMHVLRGNDIKRWVIDSEAPPMPLHSARFVRKIERR